MRGLKATQIGGFLFAFMLVISSVSLLTQGYDDVWGWFLALGMISFIITLLPNDVL